MQLLRKSVTRTLGSIYPDVNRKQKKMRYIPEDKITCKKSLQQDRATPSSRNWKKGRCMRQIVKVKAGWSRQDPSMLETEGHI